MSMNLHRLIAEAACVYSPPLAYVKIRDAVNDSRSSLADIADAIGADSSLAARLLRLANGAFYNFPSPVETITHGVTVIGTRQIVDLVLATCIIEQFKNVPPDLMSMSLFWRHGIACGIAARTIAVYRHEMNVERFYVMGLLHDIGRLVIFEKMTDPVRQALALQAEKREFLYKIERDLLGFDHADVGGALMETWKLPLSVEEAVRFHHDPARAAHYPVEAAAVHLADVLATAMQLGTSREHYVPPLDMKAWGVIGLSPGLLPAIWDQVLEKFSETARIFLEE
jgi:HD-like signal output (HDOD) protein